MIIKLFVTLYCDEYDKMTNTTFNFFNQTHKNGNEQLKNYSNLQIITTCRVNNFWHGRLSAGFEK